jgi:Integrase core domain
MMNGSAVRTGACLLWSANPRGSRFDLTRQFASTAVVSKHTRRAEVVTRRLRAMGIRDQPIAPASPWQNGFVQRLIGSIRRECVDHIIVLGEAHLRRILKSYACDADALGLG